MRVGVSALIRNPSGEVLLVRTEAAGWELPGGRVESGEDLPSALHREVLEESGCQLDPVASLAGVYHVVSSDLLLLVFHATSSSVPMPVADEDVREAGWFSPQDALAMVTHVREHQRLADALSGASDPFVRSD